MAQAFINKKRLLTTCGLSFLTYVIPIKTWKILIGIETKQKGNLDSFQRRACERFIAHDVAKNLFMNYVNCLACIGLFNCSFLFTFNYHFVNTWVNANLIKVLVQPSIIRATMKIVLSFHTSASHYLSAPEFMKLHLSSHMGNIYLKHSLPPFIHYLTCIYIMSSGHYECPLTSSEGRTPTRQSLNEMKDDVKWLILVFPAPPSVLQFGAITYMPVYVGSETFPAGIGLCTWRTNSTNKIPQNIVILKNVLSSLEVKQKI